MLCSQTNRALLVMAIDTFHDQWPTEFIKCSGYRCGLKVNSSLFANTITTRAGQLLALTSSVASNTTAVGTKAEAIDLATVQGTNNDTHRTNR